MTNKKEITAGIVIIGNEVLSGRTKDINTSTLAKWLNSLGIEVKEAREEKKGSVKYSVPSFKMGPALSKQDSSNADSVASSLKSYLDGYFNKKEEVTSGEVELDF